MGTSICAQNVAIRPLVAKDSETLLRTILSSFDHGVMLTDLDHMTIALNKKFGEIFQVDIHQAVSSEVLEVRRMVAKLIPDLQEWGRNLSLVYSDPTWTQEDELVLLHNPPIVVRRWTGPVCDEKGDVVYRLWTFRDISQISRQKRMREALYDISLLFDNDPRRVYQAVVEAVARFYQSNAILSILVDDTMEFRAVASDIPQLQDARENKLTDSYCQFTMSEQGPVVVQNALDQPSACQLLPAQVGLTRYLGVPVNEPGGRIIGTLCFLDGMSHVPLDKEDVEFMSLMAMKVSAELAREAQIADRLAEKQRVVEAQSQDLETTRQVLQSINRSFELLSKPSETTKLISKQVTLLRGLLGYDQIGLFVAPDSQEQMTGAVLTPEAKVAKLVTADSPLSLSRCFALGSPLVVPLRNLPGHSAFLVLGSSGTMPERTEHHEAHLEAVVEQVSLSLTSHVLQAQLAQASSALQDTHSQLVQSEKLSVVGTLAASTAHDIKNILSSVSIELGMGHHDPEVALANVKQHMDRFSVLAHRLLSYAKPRLVAMQQVSLSETIQRVLTLTAAHTRVTNVTVVVRGLETLPCVVGDPHQLEHLFVNLVLNAVQAMHVSGGTLTIGGRVNGGAVVVELSDTGKGIERSVLKTLFEPFASSRSEGFGLGLFSCRRIVQEHGGSIDVNAKAGKGTTFLVTLKSGDL